MRCEDYNRKSCKRLYLSERKWWYDLNESKVVTSQWGNLSIKHCMKYRPAGNRNFINFLLNLVLWILYFFISFGFSCKNDGDWRRCCNLKHLLMTYFSPGMRKLVISNSLRNKELLWREQNPTAPWRVLWMLKLRDKIYIFNGLCGEKNKEL